MKRKYTRKENPTYNHLVDKLMVLSDILNGGRERVPSAFTQFWDRNLCSSVLLELVGEAADGKYMKKGLLTTAVKPYLEAQLMELEQKFEQYKKDRIRQGFPMPTEMPGDMLKEKYGLEARLTVIDEEIRELRRRLDEFRQPEQEADDRHVLQYGLHEHGKLRDNKLVTIDGQRVAENPDMVMIISDDRSPYNGMAVSDYRQLARQWRADRKRMADEAFRQLQERCIAEGKPVPQAPPITSMRKVSRASLPKWPEGVVNHLQYGTVSK